MGKRVRLASYHQSYQLRNSKISKLRKTNMSFKMICVLIVVVVAVSAVDEGEESLMKVLAKERKEMREERKEMREQFQKENERREMEDRKIQRQNDKLHKKLEKQSGEILKQNVENSKQSAQIKKLQEQLRQAELKTKDAIRQKDEKVKEEMDTKIDKALRQERHSSEMKSIVESVMTESVGERGHNNSLERELKKLIKSEIKEYDNSLEPELKKLIKSEIKDYLISERICVSGRENGIPIGWPSKRTIQFGYTFPRKPTVSLSFHYVMGTYAYVYLGTVTTSTAAIETYRNKDGNFYVSWIACL